MTTRSRDLRPQILIIGAGLAGLSAAYKLLQLGHKSFLIIEAKHRAGGRIESHHFPDDIRVDLGAQWLHGERENPIYNWLKSLDMIEGIEEEEFEFEGLFRTQFGCEPGKEVVWRVIELLLDAKNVLYQSSAVLDTNCKPIELYRRHIRLHMETCPILRGSNPEIVNAILSWFELYETIDNSCEDLANLSMKAYSNWTDFDAGKMVKLRGGWQNVVKSLVDYIGKEKFLFDCEVKRLIYSKQGVIVQSSTGWLHCKHVIVTFSTGVMKKVADKFFKPSLSEQRLDIIQRLGFGAVNKIFLQFDAPYLVPERGLKLLWLRRADSEDLSGPERQLPEWTKFMLGFDLIDDAPNCLLSWVGGLGAPMMEQYSDQAVGETCLRVLRNFLPDKPEPPKLISIKCSRWASDRHIRGSYSFESAQTVDEDSKKLWEPIYCADEMRIQFAGEATALSSYATAHGAIMSGWREADSLSRYLKDRSNH